MKFTPSVVIDTPSYYVDHFNGRFDTDKCVILRNLQLESDGDSMPSSLRHLPVPTHVLDLTNNDLRELPNLASRTDIHTLLLARNDLREIDGKRLPIRLKNLVLANNGIHGFEELEGLRAGPLTLKNVCLLGNPLCHLEGYRERIVKILPHLEVLDFQNVTKDERTAKSEGSSISSAAAEETKDKKDEEREEFNEKKSTMPRDKNIEMMNFVVKKMSVNKKKELKAKLAKATSLDEIMRLEKLLSGN